VASVAESSKFLLRVTTTPYTVGVTSVDAADGIRGTHLFGTRVQRFVLLVGVTLGMLVAVSPVAAATELGRSGVVGPHKVVDKQTYAGATCTYAHVAGRPNNSSLVQISVSSPHVWAVAGAGDQRVGWNFSVQRRSFGLGGHGSWSTRYTSPRFTEWATHTREADFTSASVKVTVPGSANAEFYFEYRVIVKLFWFGDDGSITGSARKLLLWYFQDDAKTYDTQNFPCEDRA
jgi:hypothetical protein